VRPAGGFRAYRRGINQKPPAERGNMAMYHFSIKIISRGKGMSAVAGAAYRSGETIKNEYDGITHDYTRKRGIVHTEILLPENAPLEYSDRAILWNAVEKIEKADNSQLSREIELALPIELTLEQNISLAREYVKRTFVDVGMCADVCVHDTGTGNPHAHVMLTMRPFEKDGKWGAKSRKEYILDGKGERVRLPSGEFASRKISATDWNKQTKAEEWRAGWANALNVAYEQYNIPKQVDHRSFERQGVEQIPTIHMGVAAMQMERKGIATDRGNINRQIEIDNSALRQLRARIIKLKDWLNEEAETATPTLTDVINGILSGREYKYQWQKTADLKTAATVLNFLTSNSITDMAGLHEMVSAMNTQFYKVRNRLKEVERRLEALDKHIKEAGIYLKYKGKARTESEEILFASAKRYITDYLNGRKEIPNKAWKAERVRLNAEKATLYQDYYRLKDEVKNAETIKRNVNEIMRGDEQNKKAYREMQR